ncbi:MULTISPECIES: mycoredoxin [Corynebacterium]|uniref:Glutaredoxin-like protein n=3 Tax=Corynebacterium TaxID=1716 RepID=A0A6I8MGH9_9CORY|nr:MULTISPECIES: mycoredoxin [Corynebacterium]OLN16306.1 glutaredoxin-like protein [Corynebacterium diphtheriae subsp. lausannense]MBG9243439.1 mycoredoxin [Corynebacterium belfantii]MBG9259223.1 mycoredoxin [Corynebacterium belfantii]MBG9265967.1 mycoredoxin [Corynebacterium belfantii]MBG9269662.1 mycoredoxin [Corynebacterium diphtheriae bv. gravis]
MSDNNHVTIYAADWCPFCQRLIKALNRTETPFTLVDVEADEAASEWVKSVNNGDRIVPTVKYSDGTTATNPPASDVRKKLEELAG